MGSSFPLSSTYGPWRVSSRWEYGSRVVWGSHQPDCPWRIWLESHMRTMVLVYLPTKLGDFVRVNVGKYTIHGASGDDFPIAPQGFFS